MNYKELQNYYKSLVYTCLGSGDVQRFREGLANVVDNLKAISTVNSEVDDLPLRDEIMSYDREKLIDLNWLVRDHFPNLRAI